MAHDSGEAPRMESKRKFDEEPGNRDGSKAGLPAASVPSCSHVRPPLNDMTQSAEDMLNCSFVKFKRSRMEAVGQGQIYPHCTNGDDDFKWINNVSPEKTLTLHRERDIPFYHGGRSNPPAESAESAEETLPLHREHDILVPPREIDVPNVKTSAGGAAVVRAVEFGLKMHATENSVSVILTDEFLRVLHQVPTMNFVINAEKGKCKVEVGNVSK